MRFAVYTTIASIIFTVMLSLSADSFFPLEYRTIFWIFLCYIFVLIGIMIGNKKKYNILKKHHFILYIRDNQAVNISAYLGAAAFCLRIYDKVSRGASISFSNIHQNLYVLADYGSTTIGFLTSPFLFLCIFPFIYNKLKNNINQWYGILFWLPSLDALMYGQRFVLLTSFGIFTSFNFLNSKNIKTTIFKTFLYGMILFSLSTLVLHQRFQAQHRNVYDSIKHSEYSKSLKISSKFIYDANMLTAYSLSFIRYLQHGLFSFQASLTTGNWRYTYGIFNFPTLHKIYNFYHPNNLNFWNFFYYKGIYLSAFGNFYFDFGFFGLFYCLIIGYIFQRSINYFSVTGSLISCIISCYLCFVILFFPITSMIGYGNGNYLISSIIIFSLIKKLNPYVIKIK